MPGAGASAGRSRICTSCPSWSAMVASRPWAAPTPSPSGSAGATWTGRCSPATRRPTFWTPAWARGRSSPSWPASSFSSVRDRPAPAGQALQPGPSPETKIFPERRLVPRTMYTLRVQCVRKEMIWCSLVVVGVWGDPCSPEFYGKVGRVGNWTHRSSRVWGRFWWVKCWEPQIRTEGATGRASQRVVTQGSAEEEFRQRLRLWAVVVLQEEEELE